jgi:hypothetical protein
MEADRKEGLAASAGSAGVMVLYRTAGPRLRDHRVVLYLDADRAWTARHFARNGSQSPALGRAPMPPEAVTYSARTQRAASLRYNGQPPQDAAGLAEDLRALGLDSDSVGRLVSAAAPYLSPNAVRLSDDGRGA